MFDEPQTLDGASAPTGILDRIVALLAGFANLTPLWAFIIVVATLIAGADWYNAYIYSWLSPTIGILMILSFLGALIFSIPKKTRAFGGFLFMAVGGFLFCEFWLQSVSITYAFWGRIGVIVGAVMAGVGLVGTAFLASLFNGVWSNVIAFLVIFGIIWLLYILGAWVMGKAEDADDFQEPPPPDYYDLDKVDDVELSAP